MLPSVRAFVLVSSTARVLGAGLQSTYCSANTALAGIAAERARLGLPATLVDLPAICIVGRLSRWEHLNELLFSLGRGVRLVDGFQVRARAGRGGGAVQVAALRGAAGKGAPLAGAL